MGSLTRLSSRPNEAAEAPIDVPRGWDARGSPLGRLGREGPKPLGRRGKAGPFDVAPLSAF